MRPRHWVFGALLLYLPGCGGERDGRQHPQGTPSSSPSDSGTVSSELVQPSRLPVTLDATCDSAAKVVHAALKLDLSREDGHYTDSFQGTPRLGCRMTGRGSFAALGTTGGPVEALDAAFTRQGWTSDLRYMADGPDGSAVGLRRRDMLCLVMGRWSGHDHDDTPPRPPTEEEDRYEVIIECAREAGSGAA